MKLSVGRIDLSRPPKGGIISFSFCFCFCYLFSSCFNITLNGFLSSNRSGFCSKDRDLIEGGLLDASIFFFSREAGYNL